MKPQPVREGCFWKIGGAGWSDNISKLYPVPGHSLYYKMPCHKDDILYVRETWNYGYIETSDSPGNSEAWFEPLQPAEEHGPCIEALSRYFYKADENASGSDVGMVWRPSIHMPKEAARIWLRVTDVRVERLQDIDDEGAKVEGANWRNGKHVGWEEKMRRSAVERFAEVWNSTIEKPNLDRYGWDANPWVWVIEFERCEKPESEGA